MSSEDIQEKILDEIEEIKKWNRIQGLQTLEEVLQNFSDRDLIIYNEADGETYLSDIGEKVEREKSTLSEKFNEWHQMGIVQKEGQQWKHVAPLSSMGIEVPEIEE